jgi:N utilization substance protein A
MNIDMAALRSLEREKDVSLELLVEAIESALLAAYLRSEGAYAHARVQLDRTSGEVVVLATEIDDAGLPIREFDDTPHDFNRVAATTAKQLILQRLRDAEHELTFGEYAGREGDIVGGVIQQHDSRNVFVDLGKVEAVLPLAEQVPGERYEHGERIRCFVLQVHKGVR